MKGFDVPKEHSLQPHLQNQMEKYLPATPSPSFYSSKEECTLPRVWQEAKEKNQRLFPPANAEQDPGRGHFRAELNAAFQDTQISGHLFASPLHSLHCCLCLHLCFFPQLIYVSLAWLLLHSVFCCWHYWPFWVVTNNGTISITIY